MRSKVSKKLNSPELIESIWADYNNATATNSDLCIKYGVSYNTWFKIINTIKKLKNKDTTPIPDVSPSEFYSNDENCFKCFKCNVQIDEWIKSIEESEDDILILRKSYEDLVEKYNRLIEEYQKLKNEKNKYVSSRFRNLR